MSPEIFLATGLPDVAPRTAHPKVVLVAEGGRRYTLPAAPPLARDGLAPRYATFERVGRKPIMARGGYELKTYNVSLLVAGRNNAGVLDDQVSVEGDLELLRSIARDGERVRWEGYGPSEAGWYRITAMSEQDIRRRHGTNEITQASVTMTLSETVDAQAHVGPVTGGVAPPPAAPGATGAVAAAPAAAVGRTYTVVRGDTLAGIAIKMYKSSARWKEIADANKIADARTLKVGQVLTIP